MGLIGWLIAFLVFVGIEIATFALTTVWFAGGALVGLILYLMGASLEVQLSVFAAVSFLLLLLTRPLALQYVNRHVKKTNAESLVGKRAKITEVVDNEAGTGAAVVNGQEWTARSKREDEILEEGELARVVEVTGVKLIVVKISPEERES